VSGVLRKILGLRGREWQQTGENCVMKTSLNIVREIKFYRTIILHVGLYGCETWSLTLREERRLSVFENRLLGLRGAR
jgi:hypothetical protein